MMLNVAIITSSESRSAAHHLPILLEEAEQYRISTVLINTAGSPKTVRWLRRKLKKVWRIGPLGALIGWRMRKWYTVDMDALLQSSSLVETCTSKNDIHLHRIEGLNSTAMKDALSSSGANVAISLGNGFIAPSLFSIPRFGLLNIHHEELPTFRNSQSVIWPLHEGRNQTGYTVHEITREIDGGRILKSESLPIQFKDSLGQTVSHSCAATWNAAALGLSEVLNHFSEHRQHAEEQGPGGHFTTPTFRQYLRIHQEWKRLKSTTI